MGMFEIFFSIYTKLKIRLTKFKANTQQYTDGHSIPLKLFFRNTQKQFAKITCTMYPLTYILTCKHERNLATL